MAEGVARTRRGALGLDEFLSVQDVTRYLGSSPAERRAQETAYARDVGRFGLDAGTTRQWADFATQMSRAGTEIENSFVKALVGLATPISHLSDSVVNVVEAFGRSSQIKDLMDKVGQGLEAFAKYMGTDEFQRDVENVATGFAKVAKALAEFMSWFGGNKPAPAPSQAAGGGFGSISGDSWLGRLLGVPGGPSSPLNNPGNLRNPSGVGFQRFGSQEEGLRAMARQLRRYQTRDHLSTIADIVTKYAPPSENDTAAYIGDVAKRTGFAPNQPLDLGNVDTLARLMSAMVRHEDHKKNIPPSAIVEVINNTGGNAVVSTSQVAQ
jgi:hypothetical protein